MEALILGLSTGTYCLIACAPSALPFFLAEESRFKKTALLLALFLAGRLIAYIAVGFVLGAIGSYALEFVDPAFSAVLSRVSNLLIGLLLILAGLAHNAGSLKLCRLAKKCWRSWTGALVLGLLTGFSVCPPFFAAATRVFGTAAQPLDGALYFALFFLGTTVWFLPLLGLPLVTKRSGILRLVARMAMIMLGFYFFLINGLLGVV